MIKKIVLGYLFIAVLVGIYQFITLPSNGNTAYMVGLALGKGMGWIFTLFF